MECNGSNIVDIVSTVINVFVGICTLVLANYLFIERKQRHNATVINTRLKVYRVIVDYMRHIGNFENDINSGNFTFAAKVGFNEFRHSVDDSQFVFNEKVHNWLAEVVLKDVICFLTIQSRLNDMRQPTDTDHASNVKLDADLLTKISDKYVSIFISLVKEDLNISIE